MVAYNISIRLYATTYLVGGDKMRNSSLEQRVAMIQNIREISVNNEKTMNQIHNIIGSTLHMDKSVSKSNSKLKYRILIAMILFGIYVFADLENVQYMGCNTDVIDKIIGYNINYKEVLEQVNIQLTNGTSFE